MSDFNISEQTEFDDKIEIIRAEEDWQKTGAYSVRIWE